ncbi:uncharacterized protein PHACADRAFT_199520 [Phanerochaete carnosa HHB-10118-sp]|uniref:Alpha/beta hydrolase fold-3 domain-containing protein n=1 Tax=Phanerochaete carnosa (strain HHB-10118-sp) TaxID=650164 RepID=K5VKU3_PHACS|nr:uncharacterized protein PHACADRAFT_199520 [Phanerochaete carnosa HHB-10118-sp]EKM52018.1 hypothetical protein PHACADRAFT_199520 [Phanerochaete carnosa HHB-10118-sp]
MPVVSSYPKPRKNGFPAALIDAIAGYNFLVNVLKFEPRNVILSGDSLGGHLGFSLVRYLIQQQFPALPLPGSLLLISPISDFGGTHIGMEHWCANGPSDFTQSFYYGYPTSSLLGSLPVEWAELSPWISPGSLKLPEPHGLFKGFPRTYMVAGGAECTLDQIHTLRDRMRADIGENNFWYLEAPDSMHVYPTMFGHTPENVETIQALVQWAEEVHGQ